MKNSIFIILLLTSASSFAQSTTLHQNLYWLRYLNQISFSERLVWANEIENRRFIDPDVQNQLIFHSHLHYTVNRFEPAVGLSLSWQYAQDPETKSPFAIAERRPFQELTYHWPISKKFEIQERLRIDERFIRNHTTTELTDGYDFLFRFRFRTQAMYRLKSKYTIRLTDEVMFNDRRNTFDQNRVGLSVDMKINNNLSIELGYLHIDQERSNNKGYFSREIGRLTLHHKIFRKRTDN